MAEATSVDLLQSTLNSIKTLRTSVGQVFETLSAGVKREAGDEGGREKKFRTELQHLLCAVNNNLRDVEQSANTLVVPPGPFSLGNSSYLSQETAHERTPLYGHLVDTYRWTDKKISNSKNAPKRSMASSNVTIFHMHDFSGLTHALLSQNSFKRSYINAGLSAKRRRTQTNSHNVPPQAVDNVIGSIDKLFPDMTVTVCRPLGTNAILQITLGKFLKAIVIFKGLMIEWVMVKGYNEEFTTEGGTLDLWSESCYKVFQKVTENANAAMLHFYSPLYPELAVKSFMTWLHSFNTLFTDMCKKCGNHLHNNMPPTWRDFRALDPYHEDCKP